MLKLASAYEISKFHGQDPPPKEILEDVSARGADLLNRTVENFIPHSTRDPSHIANGEEVEGDEDRPQTPKEERADGEDGGAGGRSMRGE